MDVIILTGKPRQINFAKKALWLKSIPSRKSVDGTQLTINPKSSREKEIIQRIAFTFALENK